jgi:type II secretory pathway component PulF
MMDADSAADLITRLRGMGYFPTKIEETTPQEERRVLARLRLRPAIRQKDVEFFTFQLATLVNAGVALNRAMRICAQQMESPPLARVVEQVRYEVEQGGSFADALEQHPRVFNNLYVNMVRAGQAGGVLGVVLERLAEFSKQQRELRESVVSALIYPMILLGFATVIVVLLMFVVIPRFVVMFRDIDIPLPWFTSALIAFVTFIRSPYGLAWTLPGIPVPIPGLILGSAAIAGVVLRQYGKTERGRERLDALRMRLPLVGPIVRDFTIIRLTQTMATLLRNGVILLPALRIARDTVGSVLYRRALAKAESEIERGSGMSTPLAESGLFPPIVTDMLAIGEESGRPEAMLERLAEYYDREIKRSLERMIAALGPLLILFMAGVVVFIALAIVLPIFNLSQALR